MDPEHHDSEIVSLLTQHQSALRLYIESLAPGEGVGEDISQETNAILWTKREDFELGTNFKAWAFSIARFQVRKWRHRQAKDSRLVFCDELQDTISEEVQEHLEDLSEHQIALRNCLKKLKPSERELIHYRYYEDASLKHYSEQVGRSLGGLKVSLCRIRNRLQRCVEGTLSLSEKGISS